MTVTFTGRNRQGRPRCSDAQEASFERHEHAFRVLGGVPAGKIRAELDRFTFLLGGNDGVHLLGS
jgi:hypothetical protein